VDSAAEKEVIRIAYPYLDVFIVHLRDCQLGISIFWFSGAVLVCARFDCS